MDQSVDQAGAARELESPDRCVGLDRWRFEVNVIARMATSIPWTLLYLTTVRARTRARSSPRTVGSLTLSRPRAKVAP